MFTYRIDGMNELKKSLDRLGKVPQKYVTYSARKGMNVVSKQARQKAPYETGMLKKGIILSGERSKNKGKKVYRIVFDSKLNDVFQKKNKEGKVTAYYPVSQEYGYFTVNGRYIPGFKFIHGPFNADIKTVERTMITEMKKRIDEEIKKEGLK